MYKREKKSWLKHLDFMILDILCQQAAFIIAYVIRLGWVWPYSHEIYQRLGFVLVLIDICVVFFFEPYKGILRRNKYQEMQAVILHCGIVFVGLLIYMYAIKQSATYSRQVLFVFVFAAMLLELVVRIMMKRQIRRRILTDKNRSVMIVVTTNQLLEECLTDLKSMEYTEFRISGVVVIDKDRQGEEVFGIPVVANADNFYEYVRMNVVDEIFINGNSIESSEALSDELLEMGITVHYNLVHESKLMPNRVIEPFGNFVVMTSSMRIASPRELFVKRVFDIFGSLIGLVATGIIFLVFAPQIKKQSPGPVFFTQIRIGKNGRKFKFYKFRSMYMDAEERKKELMKENEMSGLMFKMKNDPRIIPVGRIMRKYSLDEFPQFWNVLKGDMSLVGTRPPTEDEYEQYESWHKARLGFKPGITGMWQVNGRSDIRDFEEIVALDTYYISHWNIMLDLKILFKTVEVVFKSRGAE